MVFWKDLSFALSLIPKELLKTLYMVGLSFVLSSIIGFSLGLFCIIANAKNGYLKKINSGIQLLLNFLSSVPFSVLIVFLFPLTRLIVGTSLGATASVVPLTIGMIPFVTRLVAETCLPVYRYFREAALSLGSSSSQTVFRIVLPECLPSLIAGLKSIVVSVIGLSALAGFVGGGGLGQLIMQYGYYRFNPFVVVLVLIVTLILVETTNFIGNVLMNHILKKRGLL
ncbi:MAG: ABC transporter permease subunit [Victivallaceae bacterium]